MNAFTGRELHVDGTIFEVRRVGSELPVAAKKFGELSLAEDVPIGSIRDGKAFGTPHLQQKIVFLIEVERRGRPG